MKLEQFLDRFFFFEKPSHVIFHGSPSSGGRVVACGLIDGHEEADGRFSKFCENA